MNDPILEGLIKTRDQIARPGFFNKRQYYNELAGGSSSRKMLDHPCCIFGAVGFAIDVYPTNFALGSLGRKIINLLEQHVPNGNYIGLIQFNDHKDTTQDDIVALCNRAIEARRISHDRP